MDTLALMDQMKTTFLNERSSRLSGIRTFQIGAVGSKAIFPILAIIPDEERIVKRFSNGSFNYVRRFNIEVYDKKVKTDQAFDNTVDYIHAIKNIAHDNFEWGNLAYYTEWDNDQFGKSRALSNGILQSSSLDLEIRTKEQMPERVVPATIADDLDVSAIADRIISIIEDPANEISYDYKKYGLNYYSKVMKPVSSNQIPAVFVHVPDRYRDFKKPRANNFTMNIDIYILTQLVTREKMIRYNLAIKDKIIDVLHARYSFDDGNGEGYAETSILDRVNFNIDVDNQVYNTVVTLECTFRDYV